MNDRSARSSSWVGRSGYALGTIAWATFVAYGSLVPFRFQPLPFDEALHRFARTLSGPVFIDSRTDFVTNILLTIPLGYLVLATLRSDRRGHLRHLATAIAAMPACFAFSVAVEFAQVFFPVRTDSSSDIVAQAGGAVIGIGLWLLIGEATTHWLRESLKERERSALVQRILLAYCVIFVITQVMPLDLTISLGQLARKFRNGQIRLVPFTYPYATAFDRFWDLAGDLVVNVPLGAAAALLWTYGRSRRSFARAMVVAVTAVGLIEFAQVFVNSRIADTGDVIVGSIGAAIGIAAAAAFSDRALATRAKRAPQARSLLTIYARVGVVMWVALLASYHWNPYDFTLDPTRVRVGMHQILTIPFSAYYTGTEFKALTEMLRKFLLALPLGVLLRLSFSGTAHQRLRSVAIATFGLIVLVGIEFGQVFLPTRFADLTDALVAWAGLLIGSWITGRLIGTSREPEDALQDFEPAASRRIS